MAMILTAETEAAIRQWVENGRYADADGVIGDALRLLEEQERRRQWLSDQLQIAFDQEARGELIDYTSETMERLMREADQRERRGLPIRDAIKP